MKAQLPDFNRARVLVVGDVMLDRYWQGDAARISPEAPVPVVRVEHTVDRPGGAANVALNIASLGATAALAGCTGDDEAADALERGLAAAGVDCALQRDEVNATVTKLRVVSRQQQLLRLDFEDLSGPLDLQPIYPQLSLCNALVLSDYGKGALAEPGALIAAAREQGLPVLVDPKGTDFSRYAGATLLTPNRGEFEAAVGACDDEAGLLSRGLQLIAALDIGALLITRGEQGMTLLQPGVDPLHLPARAREVFDVTGAGDTVVGVLAAALAAGAGLPQAVAWANAAAGVVVGKAGTAVTSAPELRRAMGSGGDPERGVLGLGQLQQAIAHARAQGERIVFTNGCFDILHAGHVGYLEQARALGDRLVVAVNSDDSMRRLKGEGRPVNPLRRRMAVLAGLESVDWVVPFEADTPEELLSLLRPEVLVKGGDYRSKEEVVGWQIVEAYGGQVYLAAEIEGLSSSAVIADLQGRSKD